MRQSPQQMLQHGRSIYVAEIDLFLSSFDEQIRFSIHFNGLVEARLKAVSVFMLQSCCSKTAA
jgi:hypothetical protein